jgi:hypothetical protein
MPQAATSSRAGAKTGSVRFVLLVFGTARLHDDIERFL